MKRDVHSGCRLGSLLRRGRPLLVLWAITGMAAAVATWAATAWACVPQPLILIEPAPSGAPGSQAVVHGLLFGGSGEVEIRWNHIDGPKLAAASGDEFSVPITIPAADPGLYTVIAAIRSPAGVVSIGGRASFLVTGPASASPTSVARAATAGSSAVPHASPSDHPLLQALAADGVFVVIGAAAGAAVFRRRSARSAHPDPMPENPPAE